MMLVAQEVFADETREFLQRWGLKLRYVAEVCRISENVLSHFLCHRTTLSKNQLARLEAYIADYERRNC